MENHGYVPESTDYGAIALEPSTENGSLNENPTSDKTPKKQQYGFDFQYIQRFYAIHGLLFPRLYSASSGLFIMLILLVVLKEYVVYQVGLIAGGFYVALGEKDLPAFWKQTAKSFGLICAVSFVNSITDYVSLVISVMFRKTLTQRTHQIYFADIRYYQMNVLDKAIDNPDQRMTQDVDKFCKSYGSVLPKLLVSPFTIGYYCYQGYQRSGWQGPVGCFGFFVVATTVNKLLMSPIVNYVVKQERREGDFRFVHMLVRVYSESIAFHEGAVTEHGKVNESLEKLIDTQKSLYIRQVFLTFSTNFASYIGSIFSYMMLAIPIFSGEYDNLTPSELSLLISNNAFILLYLIFTFTSVIELATNFPEIIGVTHRIGQLMERLAVIDHLWKASKDTEDNQAPDTVSSAEFEKWSQARDPIVRRTNSQTNEGTLENPGLQTLETSKLPIWTLTNATIFRPLTKDPLVTQLNFQFTVGESVIITGSSGVGKSSLFRVLRGLWPLHSGSLTFHHPPGPQGVYFCPQKGYLTWGSFREQISFPLVPDKNTNDELILHYIDQLKLTPIVSRVGGLDVPCAWSVYDSLSPGEQQRFCLLRVFYHRPVVAVLDEVTSALPFDVEKFVYSELRRLGITVISVGHRESIKKYHDKQLIIDSKGGWTVSPVVPESQI